jgi:signal transduction histidine kinase
MRLTTRFLLVLAVFTIVMVVAAVLSARIVLTNAAVLADEARARVLLQRGESVLRDEVTALTGTVEDWASWDDSYAFMADRNARFLEVNLVAGTLDSLRIHALALYDTNRQAVLGVALDSAGTLVDGIPADLRTMVEQDHGLFERAAEGEAAGLAMRHTNLWLVAAAPILTSHDEGPARGTLVMARLIDAAERERLGQLIDPTLSLVPAASDWPSGKWDIGPANLYTLRARVAIADIFGSGRLAMELTVPRVAFDQVALSLQYLTAWIVLWGVGLWVLSVWLLNRWVLRSVTESVDALRSGLAQAETSGGWRPPLKKTRHDEIGALIDAVAAAIGAIETSAREADRRRAEAVHSQRLAALGTLAAGVAHEINNPNGVVNLNLNVLRRELGRLFARIRTRGETDRETAAGDLDRIEKNLGEVIGETLSASDRIAGIVASLRSVAQPAAGSGSEPFAASDLLAEACRWLRRECEQAQCRVEGSVPSELPFLRGQRPQLLQVFINLLQNACQASTRPGMVVRVTASYDRQSHTVTIGVTDEGRGMPPEDVERALDPFFTTRRAEGGTGLGLSISAAIVKAHGGSLRIESREGEGTTATVILPVEKGDDEHAA